MSHAPRNGRISPAAAVKNQFIAIVTCGCTATGTTVTAFWVSPDSSAS